MSERAIDRVGLAGLGARLGAALIDRLPLAIITTLWGWLALRVMPQHLIVLSVVAFVLIAAWAVFQWWGYATRKAGVGYRALGLELVGARDGKPIGWWRMFLRTLVLYSTMALVVPGLALLVFLIIHERRQGWHDLAAKSLAVVKRAGGASGTASFRPSASSQARTAAIVPLPPHLLASAFANTEAPPPAAPITQVPGVAPTQPQGQYYGPQPTMVPPMPGVPTQPAPGMPQQMPQQQPMPVQQIPMQQPPAQPMPQPISQVPGAPNQVAPPVRTEPPAVRVVPRSTEEIPDDDYDGTRLVANPTRPSARPSEGGWFFTLDDGREIDIAQLVLIGRNPSPRPDEEPIATLVNAGEPSTTISRTHLAVGADARGAYVIDRGSTNGTALVLPDGSYEPCPVGVQTRVREGQIVSFGERTLRVGRRA